jgi:hypothetical protein
MAGILRTDTIQNSNTSTIITQTNSTTITIGTTGQTVALASGASQSGFGRAGSVNWDTTPKTTGFTAVSGNGYFCNTTSSAFTVTLPASPTAGDIVSIADYNGTATTNNITVGRNSSKINGNAGDFTISKNYSAISFVYVDATAGWRSVDTSNIDNVTNPYIAATGGTITTCGDYKIHTFTGPGTFTVTNAGSPGNTVDYLVVAGAGGGGLGCGAGAGGGAGGMRASATTYTNAGPSSPRTSGVPGLTVTATAYPITVGAGGAGGQGNSPQVGANDGSPSIFSTITSTGGGKGGAGYGPAGRSGNPGGSGGGASRGAPFTAGSGNTPPTSPSQGSNGGTDSTGLAGGGGGGALAAGTNSSPAPSPSSGYGGNGGVGGGFPNAFGTSGQSSGSYYYFSGGGGGGNFVCATNTLQPTSYAQGGLGGGGGGSLSPAPSAPNVQFGSAGTTNTGGGGGGGGEGPASPYGSSDGDGGNGGSGIVVIRYQFQ